MEQEIKELSLLLLYLTSWEEDMGFAKMNRSWKGYPFEILNQLNDEGYLSDSRRAKSTYLTEKGSAEAERLKEKYLNVR
ncbi:MAG TPA: DUF6429 family protein [Bacillales bacterium]|nr:DUF6429 family protein [Bacillales bacterium]